MWGFLKNEVSLLKWLKGLYSGIPGFIGFRVSLN